MNNASLFRFSVATLLLATGVMAQQVAPKDYKDHPLFPTRMPDYRIESSKVEDFGAFEFFVTKGPRIPVEGRVTTITYAFTGPRASEPSGLAIVRNYENAITKIGGTILASAPDRWVNGKIVKDGQETWAQVEKGNGKIWLKIVEKQAMEQHIVADATSLGNSLRTTGHAEASGILFDTGKSIIKPESAQAIGEIAKLLKADPALKLYVVGHTHSIGDVDANLKLSHERGEAVLQALVRDHGIDAGRLRAYGCGPFAPVASNDTEDGRAKNRRVELVKQ